MILSNWLQRVRVDSLYADPKLTLRKVHRWLGLIAGIQLLLWTVSGLYFSLIPIDEIRGRHLLVNKVESPLISRFNLISPSDLVSRYPELKDATVTDFELLVNIDSPVYLVKGIRLDAQNGKKLQPVTESEALAIVNKRTGIKSISAILVKDVEPGSEYRGGDLPAWKIDIEDENAAIYVSTASGKIRAVRTTSWRLFDFLWSLHIMDYEEREDFNHSLLIFMSTLGVITVASGLILFFTTQRWRIPRPG
ncbi:MAG: PepSY domain-containing protein [Gammaproteobacteria bacterium]|nr:PepSY domain-containing protein [Gammaproteobacteria bacterium]